MATTSPNTQQACKTQIPIYGLKQRRRHQFRLPTDPRHPIRNPQQASPGTVRWHQGKGAFIPEVTQTNATPMTPCKPNFTKRGEDLSR